MTAGNRIARLRADVTEDVREDDLISVARIARPQGHRGEVIADLLTDFPERFARLGRVYVKRADGRLLASTSKTRPRKAASR